MKLPRYNVSQGGGAPIQVGNNPSGGGTGQALVNLGSDMMSALTNYGQAKVRQEARLRDLDIQNKKELARADVELGMAKFVSSLELRNDYGNFETEVETEFKRLSKLAKSTHFKNDDFAHKQWQGDEKLLYVDYYKKVLTEKNAKTIKVAQTNYDTNKTAMFNKIDNAVSANDVLHIFQTWTDQSHTPFATTMYGTSGNETSNKAYEDAKAYAENAYLLKSSGTGVVDIKSPMGDTALNWEQIAENAADPNFQMLDIDGNVLTVDDKKRVAFIKMAREKRTQQKSFFDQQRTERAFTDNQELSNRLIKVIAEKKPDPTFVESVQNNEFISGETKRTLISSYENALKPDTTTKSYDTPQAEQASIIATTLINLGVIDTQKEKQLIIDIAGKGMLKRETYEGMLETVDKNIRARNKKDASIVARNVKMIMKSIGDDSLAAVFGDNMDRVAEMDSATLLQKVLGADMSDKGLRAIENMQALIEDGQKKALASKKCLMHVTLKT